MEREIISKSIGAMEFTDDGKGEVQAIVYTLGVVDRDGEVVLPESFQGEAKVKLSHYGHSSILGQFKGGQTEPPVGKGVVRMNSRNELEFHGNYFMSTSRGRDAYFTAKEMGPEQQWSVSFYRDRGEKPSNEWAAKGARRLWRNAIDPFEVSPVTIGAGFGTRTLGVKELDSGLTEDEETKVVREAEEALQAEQEAAGATKKAEDEAAVAAQEKLEAETTEAATKAQEEAEAAMKERIGEVMDDYHRQININKRFGLLP